MDRSNPHPHRDLPNAFVLAVPLVLQALSLSAAAGDRTPPTAPCTTHCVELTDFQSDTSALYFSRSFAIATSEQPEITPRWRHGYEIRLTRDGDNRVVFDQHGQRHEFLQQADGSFIAQGINQGINQGSLSLVDGRSVWTDANGIHTEFQGSYPVRMHFPGDQTLTLGYGEGQLRWVRDTLGSEIRMEHQAGSLATAHLPDGRVVTLDSSHCDAGTDSDDSEPEPDRTSCDTQNNPAPGFDSIVLPAATTALDARPASCDSYFVEFYGTERGEEIESGLSQLTPYAAMIPTNRSYPIVDFMHGHELIVVRSRDLASPSMNDPDNPDALHERLLRDGAQIQARFLTPLERDGAVTTTELGRTTHIVQDPALSLSLHLIIRQNMSSAEHWRQIDQARADLQNRYGIRLQVVIIP